MTDRMYLDAPASPPQDAAGASAIGASVPVALRLHDARLHARLAPLVRLAAEPDAEVLVLDLGRGERLPADAAAFDGAVLVLTDDPAHVADPSLAGVLPADVPARQLGAALAALREGLTVRLPVEPDAATGFAPADGATRPLLTPREVEVLALVGQGHSNKSIARRLNISAHTVKYHLEAIFAKLGVRSRAEAVTRGLRLGVQVL